MRDKVKRFLSILMTALMLVNLMPVGALADGITSIGYKPEVAASTGNYTVYVYARFDGDPLPGVTLNASQWYTIGYIKDVNLPSPGGISWGQYWYYNNNNYCGSTINSTSASGIIGGLVQEYNTSIVIKSDEWISANFKACPGADTYKEGTSEPTWHLDIIVDINKNPPVHNLVFKVNNSNGKQIGTPKKVTGRWTNPLSANKYYAGNPVPETIIDGGRKYQLKTKREGNPNLDTKIYFNEPIKNVEFYYKDMGPVVRNYTVNYYLKETTTKVAESITGTAPLGETVTPPTEVTGYTLVPGQETSLTIVDGNNVLNLYYYKNVELTANSAEFKYDGTQQSVSGFTGAPEGADFSAINVGVSGTDADTYPANFPKDILNTVDGTGKYIVTEANPGTLTISKREVTLTSASDEKVYDGTALTNGTVTVGGADGFADGEGATYDVTGSQTDVGESDNTFTYTLNKGTKADNYTITKTEGKLKVTAATDEVVVTIKENAGTTKYDGTEKTVTGYTVTNISNKLYTEKDFTFNGTAEVKGTDAGTYDMALKPEDFTNTNANFAKVTFKIEDGQLVIEKRKVTLTSASDSKVYDGTPLTNDTVTVGGDGFVAGEVTDIKATGSVTNVSEGEVTNTITFKTSDKFNADNYAITKTEGKLKVTPRSVTLTSGSAERVYNGEALTKNEVTASTGENEGFVKGQGATYDVTGSQTDVGESKNTFTYTLNEGTNANNYSIEVAFGTLKVTPVTAEVIVTITGRTDEMLYDGKEHSVFGYDVTVSNTLYTPKKDMQFNGIDEDMTAKGIDAGTYPMELTAEDFTNKSKNFSKVTFVVTDGYVKINPRPVTLTSETAGKTYDGTALEKPAVTVGGDGFVEGQVKEIKATGSVTNAGSVANTITFTPNKETFKEGNYAITKTEGTLTIAKRSVLITSQSATKTYDGSALTRPAVTITGDGFVPGELAKAEATGSITKVGSTPNAIQYTTTGAFNAANYSIALSVGTLTVTEKPKPEPRRTFNLTISYVYQNGKRAAASYNRGGLKNGETFDITSPVIAGYTASETVVSGTVYNRDIKVTVIYTADGVNLDDYGVPLGLGNITMNVGDCFE